MNKTALIIAREYLTRVRKRSFIIMTIIGPLLFATFLILPAWLAQVEDSGQKVIAVVETDNYNKPLLESERFYNGIPNTDYVRFQYVNAPVDILKKSLPNSEYYAILHIPSNVINNEMVELYTKKQPSTRIEEHITKSLSVYIYNHRLATRNIPLEVLNSVKANVKLRTIKLEKDGKYADQGEMELRRMVGYISGFLIYFFIFFFGSQVMRGVIEEKSNRIIEVIISSVRPFQLMMGKIIGIGLVGLTQFLIWIVLTGGIVTVAQHAMSINKNPRAEEITPQSFFEAQPAAPDVQKNIENEGLQDFYKQLSNVPFITVIFSFLFYFISGFILYGSLFAAIGAAVDSETDTQQFMLPVTIPLVFSLFIMINAFTNPEGNLAVIFSIIPLTSPVVMMARIGFDIPHIQVIASMAILVATFILTTWVAGKVYRTGILMYGKKPTYKELWKWIRYKN